MNDGRERRPVRGTRSLARLTAALAVSLAVFGVGAGLGACSKSEATTKTSSADAVVVTARGVDAGEAGAPRHAPMRSDAGPSADDTALPPAGSEELSARMRHLLEAIVQGNGELANDVLFPRDGYLLLRDSPDAAKAWEKKVASPFQRSVDRMHKHTKGIANAKFVGFELGHSVQQVTPKRKDWKAPVWRVKGSKLTFTVDGKQHQIRIAEMTAYRGAWYVTRLR